MSSRAIEHWHRRRDLAQRTRPTLAKPDLPQLNKSVRQCRDSGRIFSSAMH